MLALTSASNSSNAAIANTLNASSFPVNSTAVLAASSGLVDPLQQSFLPVSSSSSTDAVAKAGIIVIGGTPQSALNSPGDLVSLNPQPLPPRVSTDVSTADLVTLSSLPSGTLALPLVNPGDRVDLNTRSFGTRGGSTLDAATDLGTLNGTRSLFDLMGVSTTSPNDYYRVTLGENSNFNLSMTGLSADADVQFLNSLGEEIARSNYSGNHDEAINVSGLAAGDYYIHVYQFSGDTGFSLNLSTTSPSNLLPHEFELVNGIFTTTQTGFISNTNTADIYHFRVDGPGDTYPAYDGSRVSIDLSGLSNDADIRLIWDKNHNGITDPGEEIDRSISVSSSSESIKLNGLISGDYYLEVHQFNGSTPYTLDASVMSYAQALQIPTLPIPRL